MSAFQCQKIDRLDNGLLADPVCVCVFVVKTGNEYILINKLLRLEVDRPMGIST